MDLIIWIIVIIVVVGIAIYLLKDKIFKKKDERDGMPPMQPPSQPPMPPSEPPSTPPIPPSGPTI